MQLCKGHQQLQNADQLENANILFSCKKTTKIVEECKDGISYQNVIAPFGAGQNEINWLSSRCILNF